MPRNIIAGIDIGSTKTRVVIGSFDSEGQIQIIGIGEALSRGVRRGTIIETEEANEALQEALGHAQRMAGITLRHAFFAIGGGFVNSQKTKGVIAVSRADGEISQEDIYRAISAAQAVSLPLNREILHTLPLEFIVDGEGGIRDPLGMQGIRLEVEILLVDYSSPSLKNLERCAEVAGMGIENVVLSPLAAASSALSKRQKELGVAILDLGGGSTGLAVYEEGEIVHANIFPVGGSHISNDLAIGMRIPIDIAEKVKVEHGNCMPEEINPKEAVSLTRMGFKDDAKFSKREIAEIIQARVEEIFYLINKDLRKIGRQALLPGGVVLVGGGAKLPGIADFAKQYFKLPAQIGFPQGVGGIIERVDDPAFASAVGILAFAKNSASRQKFGESAEITHTVSKIKRWFKGFLP